MSLQQDNTADIVDICDGGNKLVLSSTKYIVSPGYVGQQMYPLNTDCSIEIAVQSGQVCTREANIVLCIIEFFFVVLRFNVYN